MHLRWRALPQELLRGCQDSRGKQTLCLRTASTGFPANIVKLGERYLPAGSLQKYVHEESSPKCRRSP